MVSEFDISAQINFACLYLIYIQKLAICYKGYFKHKGPYGIAE